MILGAWLVFLFPSAHAHDLPDGVQIGMTAQQMQQVVPALQPVRHPARLAGGLVGSWSGAVVHVQGVALVPTFYMAGGHLQRIEYLAQADAGPQGFDALLAWGRNAFGPETASTAPEARYATWSDDAMAVYLQRTEGAQPALRLVVKQAVAKDGSEL